MSGLAGAGLLAAAVTIGAAPAPNVLFISADDLRFELGGVWGAARADAEPRPAGAGGRHPAAGALPIPPTRPFTQQRIHWAATRHDRGVRRLHSFPSRAARGGDAAPMVQAAWLHRTRLRQGLPHQPRRPRVMVGAALGAGPASAALCESRDPRAAANPPRAGGPNPRTHAPPARAQRPMARRRKTKTGPIPSITMAR